MKESEPPGVVTVTMSDVGKSGCHSVASVIAILKKGILVQRIRGFPMYSALRLHFVQTNRLEVPFKIVATGNVSEELKEQVFIIWVCLRRFYRWRLAPISLPSTANFLNIWKITVEPKFPFREIQQAVIEFYVINAVGALGAGLVTVESEAAPSLARSRSMRLQKIYEGLPIVQRNIVLIQPNLNVSPRSSLKNPHCCHDADPAGATDYSTMTAKKGINRMRILLSFRAFIFSQWFDAKLNFSRGRERISISKKTKRHHCSANDLSRRKRSILHPHLCIPHLPFSRCTSHCCRTGMSYFLNLP